MLELKVVTIYDLENLIARAIKEWLKSLPKSTPILVGSDTVDYSETFLLSEISNDTELVKHISKTIIGELYELEIIRKIAPMFRMFKELERDFSLLDNLAMEESRRLNLRVPEE